MSLGLKLDKPNTDSQCVCSIGVVFNYTKPGVRQDQRGWEMCISIPLIQPDMFNLLNQWDQYLNKFSDAEMWDPAYKRCTLVLNFKILLLYY